MKTTFRWFLLAALAADVLTYVALPIPPLARGILTFVLGILLVGLFLFFTRGRPLAGVRAQLYTEQKKFKQKMSYADKTGIPYVVFLGEDEIARGVVSVKDMASGQQQTLPQAQAIALIQSGIATRANAAPIREPERS